MIIKIMYNTPTSINSTHYYGLLTFDNFILEGSIDLSTDLRGVLCPTVFQPSETLLGGRRPESTRFTALNSQGRDIPAFLEDLYFCKTKQFTENTSQV